MHLCIACGQHTVSSFRFLCVPCQQFVDVKATGDGRVAIVVKNEMTVEELMKPRLLKLSAAAQSEVPTETVPKEPSIDLIKG